MYNKFTKKIDDIFEEAHLSKSLNLQINERIREYICGD